MLEKRGTDHGTFQVDCQGSESACNNACYYNRCLAANDPDANLITYIGPNQDSESQKNRRDSACQVGNPKEAAGTSMCTNFPFSQKYSDPTTTTYDCDEWPPAMSQQRDFNSKTTKNSLRCMPQGENRSLGGKLGNFAVNMARDDFFRVDFTTQIASVDQSKVKYCKPQLDCTQDGFQIMMTEKKVGGGKIQAPYFLASDNNKYQYADTPYDNLYQCSVELQRDGDKNIKNIKLFTWENKQGGTTSTCTLNNDGDTCNIKGLPVDLQIKHTGAFGSKLGFEYAPGQKGANVNNFAWDSEQKRNGRGPWTDADPSGARDPLRYGKVQGNGANSQTMECWFPCWKTANGR